MPFNCTDIETFKVDLESNLNLAQKLKRDTHVSIKIQGLLNITIYALACRFLEGSIKLIVYNCAIMRGDTQIQLTQLESDLKKFNNPEYANIKTLFSDKLNFDITTGLTANEFSNRDISFLDQIVKNRHRNVHATHDPREWHSVNIKDILNDFPKEYGGLLTILQYLDCIRYDVAQNIFIV